MLDEHGYRPNVGIILVNRLNQVFWAKRIREEAWQFPQGGIQSGEDPDAAMYRELLEETGLRPDHVQLLGRTQDWLRYNVPTRWVRREWRGLYKGQKQLWYLLRMLGEDADVQLKSGIEKPEFDDWRWQEYWIPIETVIEFKREVYTAALSELAPLLFPMDEVSTRLSLWISSGSSTKPSAASI